MFAWKALLSKMCGGQLFRAPRSNKTVSFQTQRPVKSIGGIIKS